MTDAPEQRPPRPPATAGGGHDPGQASTEQAALLAAPGDDDDISLHQDQEITELLGSVPSPEAIEDSVYTVVAAVLDFLQELDDSPTRPE